MTGRERLRKVLHFEKPDRMPMVEWAAWWDLTFSRWKREGLENSFNVDQSLDYFGLDNLVCISFAPWIPEAKTKRPYPVCSMEDYLELKANGLYSDAAIENAINAAKSLKARHDAGDISIRIWLDGFFWYPRRLFGIEPHFYAFYDYPELMTQINSDLCEFNIKAVNALYEVLVPEFMGLAEDMSYNHGPMLSHDLFAEFITPYYRRLIPHIKKQDVPVLIDSDGDITEMIPWMMEAGIEGVYPLERQAGVDINTIRKLHPDFLMLGGYDKMVMSKNEKAMREEFERILPVMKSGGYIPSVDHQTPPEVSLENYRIYAKLFKEYAQK